MTDHIYTFCLPDIGEGVVEGEVVEWLKNVGDRVTQDEPVVVVMTDKATVELPAPYPGIIKKHYYKTGEISIKDKPLYDIEVEGDKVHFPSQEKAKEEKSLEVEIKASIKPKEVLQQVVSLKNQQVKALPKVRHEAKKWGIDLNKIAGSGHDGRVTEEDIHHALSNHEAPRSCKPLQDDEEQQLVGVRGLMARKMNETRIPQFSYFEQVDVTRLIQLRQNIKVKASEEGINLSYMPFFIRALSLTIKRFPQINASLDMNLGKVYLHKLHNVGIAIATPQGLIVPVLKGVESMGLIELIRAYEELKMKALASKFSSSDMKDATITVSNFGVLGGDGMWATPMISDPEVAILAVARIRKAPVVKGESVVVRDVLPLSWSFDHRLIDGELAAHISHHYSTLLKDPAFLL